MKVWGRGERRISMNENACVRLCVFGFFSKIFIFRINGFVCVVFRIIFIV